MVWYDRLLILCSFCIYRWFSGRLKLIEGLKPITGCKYLYFITVEELIYMFVTRTFFNVIPMIQERQLSVSGERMCTILVNRLEG